MYERTLIEYLPHIIRDVREYKAIMNDAEQPEMVDVWQAVDDALNDQFIVDATENGVSRWEKNLKDCSTSNPYFGRKKVYNSCKNQ